MTLPPLMRTGADPLIGRVASARWLTETEKAQHNLESLATNVTLPILYQQAGDDRLVDAEAGRRVFDAFASQDKTWQAYPDQFHEIGLNLNGRKPWRQCISGSTPNWGPFRKIRRPSAARSDLRSHRGSWYTHIQGPPGNLEEHGKSFDRLCLHLPGLHT